jgi:hypothetical protein
MSRSGYIVETKSGKLGKTYISERKINKKIIVHIDGEAKPLLCDPKSLKRIGFIN